MRKAGELQKFVGNVWETPAGAVLCEIPRNDCEFACDCRTFQLGSMSLVSLPDLKFRKSAAADLKKAAAADNASAFQKKLLKQWGKSKLSQFGYLPDHRLSSTVGAVIFLANADADLYDCAAEATAAPNEGALEKAVDSAIHAVSADAAKGRLATEFSILLAIELLSKYGALFSVEQFRDTVLAIASFDLDQQGPQPSNCHISDILSQDGATESEIEAHNESEAQMVRAIVRFAEIPYRRSVLLDSLEGSPVERKVAMETVAQAIEASTDSDGTVHRRLAKYPVSWMAPFIRISSVAAGTGNEWAKAKTIKRWIAALEFFAALSIHGGWLNHISRDEVADDDCSFVDPHIACDAAIQPVHLFRSALAPLQIKDKASGKKGKKAKSDLLKESSIPDVVAAMLKTKGRAKKKPGAELDWYSPSTQSDWAAMALLRTGYEVDANSIWIDWDSSEIRLALSAFGCAVVGGDWQVDIQVNGQEVNPVGDWTCTCWFQDDEVAFAELERGSTDETRHVRHVMLHLKDHFAVLAESVLTKNQDDQIVLQTSLPVASNVQPTVGKVTREIFLATKGPACRFIPAWLPDDRIDSTDGDCRTENGMLKCAAVGQGGVFMPLLIDWAPKNSKREADWTKLTITEDSQILTGHKAEAVRTRIGRQQLLMYRSLSPGDTLRAVLGHHTANETVYGKFTNEGEVEPLVMVEPTAEG